MITGRWPKGIKCALSLWLAFVLCLVVPALAAAQWHPSANIDAAAGAGQYVSLAIGSDGNLHVSYVRGTSTYDVIYAKGLSDGSGWESTAIDTGTKALAGTAVGVDASNLPQVAYYNAATKKLNLKFKGDTGVWTLLNMETLTPATDAATTMFRYKGKGHLTYNNSITQGQATRGLTFANYSGSARLSATVDNTSGGAGRYSAAVADTTGRFHVVYFDVNASALKYATSSSVTGPWTQASLPTATGDGRFCALAIDAQDRLHLSYASASGTAVMYQAKPADGVWSAATNIGGMPATGGKAGSISMAVDGAGFVHLSYYGNTNVLMYATNAGGSWNSEVVPHGSGNYGMYSSLKLDRFDNVYIAFYDVAGQALKLARKQSNASIAVAPSSIDFGSVVRGSSSSRNLTISNNGSTTLTVSSIVLTGASAGQFSAGNCSSVAPGANCLVPVTVTPDSGGVKGATLTITSNASTPTVQVPLAAASPWQIVASVGNGGNGGSITPAGVINVDPGQGASFSIASAGIPFSIGDVLVDQASVGAVTTYNFTNVSADHSIQSLFVSPIRIVGIPYLYFASLQQACDAVVGSEMVQAQATLPAAEYLLLTRPVETTIKGGYDTAFASQSGGTVLQAIDISNGNLTPEGLVLR